MTKSHPLDGIGLHVRNFMSFGEDGGDMGMFHPINIVIGRNNTGKSALVRVIDFTVSKKKNGDFSRCMIRYTQGLGDSIASGSVPRNAISGYYFDYVRSDDRDRLRELGTSKNPLAWSAPT